MEKSSTNEEIITSAKQQFNCHMCKTTFDQFDEYISHFETCKDYICESCSKSFSDAGGLKTHINGIHKEFKSNTKENVDVISKLTLIDNSMKDKEINDIADKLPQKNSMEDSPRQVLRQFFLLDVESQKFVI